MVLISVLVEKYQITIWFGKTEECYFKQKKEAITASHSREKLEMNTVP
jgi:hypothetical protein